MKVGDKVGDKTVTAVRPMGRPPGPKGLAALANPSPGHARLGPSSAKRWLACPGSLTLEAPIPNRSSDASDEGTACHDVSARCLINHIPRATKFVGEYIEVHHTGEPRRTVEFTPEMAALSQTYIDFVRSIAFQPGSIYWCEQRVSTSEWLGIEDQFGTADGMILAPYRGPDAQEGDVELIGIDAKFGWTPVTVEENPQVLLYALGFLTALMRGNTPQPVKRKVIPIVIDTSEENEPLG